MICHLNPILNGASNLCSVSKTMNHNKTRSDPADAVILYMREMQPYMQRVIDAIRTIEVEGECVTIFANKLVQRFNATYTLRLR